MKTKTLLTLIAAFLVSCAPAPATQQAASPAPAGTLLPTLPPTLTPLPSLAQPQATPTALYAPMALSAADEQAYQKALQDIPLYRQGDLQVRVEDKNGAPLPGYRVHYRQVSHDFQFGGISNNFSTGRLRQAGVNTWSTYMAWNWVQPEYGKFTLDFANYWLGIDELKSAGMTVRTNALYDLAPAAFPAFYRDVPYEEFLKRLYEHVSAAVKRFAPSVDSWEAVLEPNFGNHNPLNLTKDEYYRAIATSIRAIRDNDPTAAVEINLSYPCGGLDWLDNFELMQEMLDRELDFDTLGLQFYYNAYMEGGTFEMTKMSLSEMSSCYDRYQAMLTPYGKRIVGAEFSVPAESLPGNKGYWDVPWSEDTQAQYLSTAYTIFFSKPSNLGLVWWNTVEPSPFVYQGGLIREDGTPRKSLYALERLIDGWTTSGEGVTDESGLLVYRGFGGEYELEILNPNTGERMLARAHITEGQSGSESITFIPNNVLSGKETRLDALIAYWDSKADSTMVQKGREALALVDHHLQSSEWDLAGQTLDMALDQLAIRAEMLISPGDLLPVGFDSGGVVEQGSALMWGSTTLHLQYDFPPGTVTVEITAHAQSEKGEFPLMVSGVGANYSQVWKVENSQQQVYTFTVSTTGSEQDFTIRFPYDDRIYERIDAQAGDAGELKLYIDAVKLIIKTTQVP